MQEGAQFDPFMDPYVEKFFDLAREYNIAVQIIEPPYRVNQFRQYERMPRQYCDILERYKNVVITPRGWKAKFYDNRYFSDLVHLNPEGAERFTAEMAAEFQQIKSFLGSVPAGDFSKKPLAAGGSTLRESHPQQHRS